MSGRISDERHQQLLDYYTDVSHCFSSQFERDVANALRENKQSRALVAELRALAERMHKDNRWRHELDSLLSAHAADAETK